MIELLFMTILMIITYKMYTYEYIQTNDLYTNRTTGGLVLVTKVSNNIVTYIDYNKKKHTMHKHEFLKEFVYE